jgi:hypothetical protein
MHPDPPQPSVLGETLLTTSQAARRFPSDCMGGHIHIATIHRWIMNGICGPDGRRIHLEAVRVGSRWLTSCEAIQRFADQLKAVRGHGRTPCMNGEPIAPRTMPSDKQESPASAA